MLRAERRPGVEPVQLSVGDHVRLGNGAPARWWWRVQAVSENYVACVHQAEFQKKGVLCYTVLDWEHGVRGPCNIIGQGYGDGSYSEEECQRMLDDFEHVVSEPFTAEGQPIANHPVHKLEVSHRNSVRIDVLEVRRG